MRLIEKKIEFLMFLKIEFLCLDRWAISALQ